MPRSRSSISRPGASSILSDLDPVGLEQSGTDPEHVPARQEPGQAADPALDRPGDRQDRDVPQGADPERQDDDHVRAEGAVQGRSGPSPAWTRTSENAAASQVKITIDDAAAGVNLFKGAVKKGDKPIDLNLNVTERGPVADHGRIGRHGDRPGEPGVVGECPGVEVGARRGRRKPDGSPHALPSKLLESD